MSTLNTFFIKTTDQQAIIKKLKSLSANNNPVVSKFPTDFLNTYFKSPIIPYYLALTQTSREWVAVTYNNFNHLENWCLEISTQFDTIIIVIHSQTTADYYYFALYESGEKKREIEVCHTNSPTPTINFGAKLSFEEKKTGKPFYFGRGQIESYCKQYNLDFSEHLTQTDNWTIFKKEGTNENISSIVNQNSKKWWKLW